MPVFLTKYWKHIVLVGVVIVIAVYHGHLTGTIADQKVKLVEQKQQIDTLSTSLKTQNDAIDTMKREADAREIAGKKAVEAARAQAQTYKQRADILRRTQPKFPADLCLSANDLINEELKK